MQKILLTRSALENKFLAKELKDMGFIPVFFPMIKYKKLVVDFQDFSNFKDIIITSKFAAKIIRSNYTNKANCFVVGKESSKILMQNPNLNIVFVSENAEKLDEYLVNYFKINTKNPYQNSLVYLSGDIITAEFPYAKRHMIYEVKYPTKFPSDIENSLQKGVKYIFLYSKNSGLNLINLLNKYNLLQNIKNSVVIAISHKLAIIFEKYVEKVLFPTEANAAKMIDLLVDYDRRERNKEERI